MELEKFIKESIIECVNGVVSAQRDERIKSLGAIVAPSWSQKVGANYNEFEKCESKDIELEVAVTTSNKAGGGFGINVASVLNGNLKNENTNASISKVKLSIPILFPTYNVPESD